MSVRQGRMLMPTRDVEIDDDLDDGLAASRADDTRAL